MAPPPSAAPSQPRRPLRTQPSSSSVHGHKIVAISDPTFRNSHAECPLCVRSVECRTAVPALEISHAALCCMLPSRSGDDGDGNRKAARESGRRSHMMEAFDAWELRWIARHLPTLDEAGLPSTSFDSAFMVVYEHDVYVLTQSDRMNLKVRHRENSLKLKTLL